ncbi:MAG: Gfo/Idh/MocA family oxidoreductase [Ruminococcaceae bacterium]|nr:Gfo/Idh/MocA family oxidoreductase [Oscillospiraceae bacterium]
MLKLAIVGTGIIMKSHVTAINQLDDVELVAVCDVNEEKAKRYSEQCGVPYVLDYKELPSKIDFDAVLLNLPHGLHCEVAEFFLDAGKHVLVEKPMANTVEECDRMIAAAERNNKKLAVAHIQRFGGAIREIKRVYESGELGKLCMFTENRCEDYFYDARPAWFLSKKMAGGGIAMNFAAHAFDKLFSVMEGAKLVSVDAQCGNLTRDYDVEGHAQIFAKFDNGVSGCITLNGYNSTGSQTYFYFTKGALRINGRTLEINRGDKEGYIPVELPPMSTTNFANEIDAFHRYIKGEESDIPTGEYSRQIIDAIQTAYTKSI